MPSDAVWIVISIPKDENEEKESNVDVKSKGFIQYNNDKSYLSAENNNNSNNNLKNIHKISDNSNSESLEKILDETLTELGITNAVWINSKNNKFHNVYFPVDLYDNDSTLNYLQSKGIGVKKDSCVGYIPFGLFFANEEVSDEDGDDEVFTTATASDAGNGSRLEVNNNKHPHHKGVGGFKKMQEEFLKSVTSRLTVAQVVNGVRSSAELTFDFVMYAVFAGCIAAAGLLNNSAVDVAAAMMIEPVMATVIAITFGLVIRDTNLTYTGCRSCIISLLICLLVGYVYGGIAFIWMKEWNPPPSGYWPTPEMSVRGMWRTLWYGALQALAAGGAIAVTLLNDNQAALVGVAVASTFLPPFINTGLLWAYATHITVKGQGQKLEWYNSTFEGKPILLKRAWMPDPGYEPLHYEDMRWEIMALSGVSMIYTLVNIICMLVMAYVILRVKEVVPLGSLEPNKRFFTKDIRVARDYNRRMTMANLKGVDNEAMGDQILSEWAEIAGLDAGTLMSDRPEAAVTRRQTLHDILADVNMDNTYQSVTKSGVGVKNESENFIRGLTFGTSLHRRKSSLNPGLSTHVYDVEGNLRVSPSRRSSRWYPSTPNIEQATPNQSSSISSINPIDFAGRRPLSSASSFNRGLRPQDVSSRRNSAMLRKTLKESEHSPFSLWPAKTSRDHLSSSSSMHLDPREMETRRRKSAVSFSRRLSRNAPISPKRPKGAINESFESE